MATNDIKGTLGPYETDGEAGSIDEGILRGTLTYHVPTLSDAKTYGPTSYEGAPLRRRNWKWSGPDEGYDITLDYEGPEGGDGSDGSVELDVSFAERPISAHPNIQKIMDVYGGSYRDGNEGEVHFPDPDLQKGDQSGVASGKAKIKNPMFGVTTYLYLAAVVRQTKVEARAPDLSNIGKVVNHVPGGYKTPKDHDWMIMPPKSRKLASGDFETTYEYLMSERGGWPRHVYGFLIDR